VATRTRIALIHATPLAIEPVRAALIAHWAEAEPVNILDDALSRDRGGEPLPPPAVADRILALAAYARRTGCAGILFTCSAFGPAIERAAVEADVPVLKPNEAMFREAIAKGDRIGMLATAAMAVPTLAAEFEDEARRCRSRATLTTVVVPDAMAALQAGRGDAHDAAIATHALELAGCDAVMLAQFSMARAAAAVRGAITAPVLTSPDSAVCLLRELVAGLSTAPPLAAAQSGAR
jgi:aspartate/glutamate racemase